MSTHKYLLIGGYAAAHAAKAIRERDKEGTILLINSEPYYPTSARHFPKMLCPIHRPHKERLRYLAKAGTREITSSFC